MSYRLVDVLSDFRNSNLYYQREVACFIDPNFGVVDISTNNSGGHVDFNFEKIWEHIRSMEYVASLSEVWMIHSHPTGFNHFSSMDHSMKKGWALGLAIPINFAIVTDGQYRIVNVAYDKTTKKVTDSALTSGFCSHGIDLRSSDLDPNYIATIFDLVWGLSLSENDCSSNFDSLVDEINMEYPPSYYSPIDLVERSWFELISQ